MPVDEVSRAPLEASKNSIAAVTGDGLPAQLDWKEYRGGVWYSLMFRLSINMSLATKEGVGTKFVSRSNESACS